MSVIDVCMHFVYVQDIKKITGNRYAKLVYQKNVKATLFWFVQEAINKFAFSQRT